MKSQKHSCSVFKSFITAILVTQIAMPAYAGKNEIRTRAPSNEHPAEINYKEKASQLLRQIYVHHQSTSSIHKLKSEELDSLVQEFKSRNTDFTLEYEFLRNFSRFIKNPVNDSNPDGFPLEEVGNGVTYPVPPSQIAYKKLKTSYENVKAEDAKHATSIKEKRVTSCKLIVSGLVALGLSSAAIISGGMGISKASSACRNQYPDKNYICPLGNLTNDASECALPFDCNKITQEDYSNKTEAYQFCNKNNFLQTTCEGKGSNERSSYRTADNVIHFRNYNIGEVGTVCSYDKYCPAEGSRISRAGSVCTIPGQLGNTSPERRDVSLYSLSGNVPPVRDSKYSVCKSKLQQEGGGWVVAGSVGILASASAVGYIYSKYVKHSETSCPKESAKKDFQEMLTELEDKLGIYHLAEILSNKRGFDTEAYMNQAFNNECPICLEPFAKGENVKTLGCLHKFHEECLKDGKLLKCVYRCD